MMIVAQKLNIRNKRNGGSARRKQRRTSWAKAKQRRLVLVEVIPAKARPEKRENIVKPQIRHLRVTTRAIMMATGTGGTAIENVMRGKDIKGHAFSPLILIDMFLAAVSTAAHAIMMAVETEIMRKRNLASVMAVAAVTITKSGYEKAKVTDLTKGCKVEIAIATKTGSGAGAHIGDIGTSGIVTETETETETKGVMPENVKDGGWLYRLIAMYQEGRHMNIEVAIVTQHDPKPFHF